MPDENDIPTATLELIGLYRLAVRLFLPMLREPCNGLDLDAAVRVGNLGPRGRLRLDATYRIQGDHIVIMFQKHRIEFDYAHPEAFSEYLLRRHIDLNRKIARFHRQCLGLPVARDLSRLQERGLITTVEADRPLFALTPSGLAKLDEMQRQVLLS
jgi:hypothetical protein